MNGESYLGAFVGIMAGGLVERPPHGKPYEGGHIVKLSRVTAGSFAVVLSPVAVLSQLAGLAASLAAPLPARGADVQFTERVISTAGTGAWSFFATPVRVPRPSEGKQLRAPEDYPRGLAPPAARPVTEADLLQYGRTAVPVSPESLTMLTPTDSAFGPDSMNGFVGEFVLNTPETLSLNGVSYGDIFMPAADFGNNGDYSFLYVLDEDSKRLIQLDTSTSGITDIGPAAPLVGEFWTGLAMDPTTGTMYASSVGDLGGFSCGGGSALYTIDLFTGTPTLVGPVTNAPCLIAIAVDSAGQMYGYGVIVDSLMSIEKGSGAGTVIGSLGFDANFSQGMDFDASDGTLYLTAFNNATFQAELRTANTETGATTLVGVLGSTTPGGRLSLGGVGIAPLCGNGSIDPGEECDGTGESATCDTDCTVAQCGDGTLNVTAGEECDGMNDTACPAACLSDCTCGPFCGDGSVDAGEECDGGGESAACNTDCTVAQCGDGTLNVTAGEECDGGLGCTNCLCDADFEPTAPPSLDCYHPPLFSMKAVRLNPTCTAGRVGQICGGDRQCDTGPLTFDGQCGGDITPTNTVSAEPGDIIVAEIFGSNWSPDGQRLKAYQVSLDEEGFTSGCGTILPYGWDGPPTDVWCETDANCPAGMWCDTDPNAC